MLQSIKGERADTLDARTPTPQVRIVEQGARSEMTHEHLHHDDGGASQTSYWTSRAFLVFLGFAAIAVVLLWEEHKAHILGALPYVFLFACLFMHLFMHGGHGGHGHGRSDQDATGRDGGKS